VPGKYTVSVGSGQPDTGVTTRSAGFELTNAVKLPE
jgi:hypothetical protein